MGATKTPDAVRDKDEAMAAFTAEGCSTPTAWSNGPKDTHGWHAHERHKVLFCLEGSITFKLDEGDVTLEAGDRLDLEPVTDHAARVGPEGCTCIEAWR